MEKPKEPKLLQQAEKILLHSIHPHLIAYCPTMDLIALVTDEENLDVYRINGQRAFGLRRKMSSVSVDCICWEFNGQALAISWSDGFTDILSAETGKVIHKDLASPPSAKGGRSRITCIGWGLNFIDAERVKRRTGLRTRKVKDGSTRIDFMGSTTEEWDALKDDISIEDFQQRQPDLQKLDIAPDLPDQLTMMDVEALLPKLPAIPAPPMTPLMRLKPQSDPGVFGTQAQVDTLLHSSMKDHNSVDMFVRCTDAGTVHPSIYDSLETMNVRLPSNWPLENSKPLLHTSHPYSCSHGILTEIKGAGATKLAYVPLNLGFIPSAGIYLHLISSKASHLQNLLLYTQQTLQRIRTFWKHSQELPSKFMANISETLEEKGQGTLVDNLYQLACTGYCTPTMKEWLVDELAEAGHKRWDNTVTTSHVTLLQLIHENLLPAIDRCSIIISRLRGLAQYHEQEWIFSGPVVEFTHLLELLKTLRLLGHTSLLYAGDEKRQFVSFSKWLRYCIDFEATEPGSQSREEMEARDPGVDIALVLEYIRYSLTRSDLMPYLRPEDQLPEDKQEETAATYDETRKAIDLLKHGATYRQEALCLDHVLGHFTRGCKKLFQQISQWQEGNSSMDSGLVLEDTIPESLDMRMVFDPIHPTTISTHITLLPPSSPTLHLHTLTHTLTSSSLPRLPHPHVPTTLSFPPPLIPIHSAFADDTTLLILLSSPPDAQRTTLLALTYRGPASALPAPAPPPPPPPPSSSQKTDMAVNANLLPLGSAPRHRSMHALDAATCRRCTLHVFEGRFQPVRMVVNGREGRRVVLVLGADGKHYRVLDLDYAEGSEGGSEGGGEGDVEMGG
ncbi:hypothetical protein EJ04DRAFT_488639 [Polyplosphaeria fusca]|uniref:Anaphase-promoting complex subunit 4 n=1 Tax=Polyplosphaeria fusca TaxID=682080 RepID=A0A9P4R116_9PLEO|nr:hypothetical protein EJ04DRAFT_488639 [Polyplosphaeria fusca]